MNFAIAILVSLAAGVHIATWGMYKDAPHEGYRSYTRAMIIAVVIGAASALVIQPNLGRAANVVVFFGCIYAAERAWEELYKTFFRESDQTKYFIPMQFHIGGKVVESRAVRWSVGAAWAVAVLAVGAGLWWLNANGDARSQTVVVVLAGSVGGWLSAVGGAAKDAPLEGFSAFKFMRSPLIAAFYAFLLSYLSDNLLLIAFGAIGYTVATIETYKTFFFPNKPRGKFAGKPVLHPEWLVRRYRYVPIYAFIWLLVIVGFVAGLSGR